MPGALNQHFPFGFSREVGKMASAINMDLDFNDIFNDHEDLLNGLFEPSTFSASHLSLFKDNSSDSDSDLPDNEKPVHIFKYMDCHKFDIEMQRNKFNKCVDICDKCKSPNRLTSDPPGPDPFWCPPSLNTTFGLSWFNYFKDMKPSFLCPDKLVPTLNPDIHEDSNEETVPETKTFSAWIPIVVMPHEEPDDFMPEEFKSEDYFIPESFMRTTDRQMLYDSAFPDPSSPEGQPESTTGDDSDVDIETITEAPRSADLWESSIQYSSPAASPPSSPEAVNKFRFTAHVVAMSKPVAGLRGGKQLSAAMAEMASTSQNTSRTSSSKLQTENFDANHCATLGQKRKLAKDKKFTRAQSQPAYTHVLCNSNSVNFHDYAMSPTACASPSVTETAQPTVLSKRIYRRNTTVDAFDKEKQNHHNQLERNRRQKLADLFTDLRDQVPTITGNAKASKVHILKEATSYVHDLQRKSKLQEDDISREARKRELLRSQLRQLQAKIYSRVK